MTTQHGMRLSDDLSQIVMFGVSKNEEIYMLKESRIH